MGDSPLVGRSQRLGQGDRQSEEPLQLEASTRDQVGEGLARDQLHHQKRDPLILVHLVDGDDVAMVELGERACLDLEAAQPLAVLGQLRRQHLDGDVSLQPRVPGPVHGTHPTPADLREDSKVAECAADQGGLFHRGAIPTP